MKTVILVSGGLDSVTMLYECVQQSGREDVRALAFDYGQRNKKELSYAYLNATKLGVPLKVVDLGGLKKVFSSSLTDDSIAVAEGRQDKEGMKKNTVPNRNMVFLSIGISYAISLGFECVAYAAHKGGFDKDTHPEFIEAMDKVAALCDWKRLKIHSPFIELSKGDLIKRGIALGIDYSQTWTCYQDNDRHCGKCSTCCDRILAFKEAGVEDPTSYLDPGFALTDANTKTPNQTTV